MTSLFEKYGKDFKQSKNWCFTEFNMELNLNKIYEANKDIITYICWGVEICPTTKKEHYQGWLQFLNKKRLGGVKKLLKTAHLTACNGTEEQNDEYCQKDNNYTTIGEYTRQGARSDLEQLKKLIDTGVSLENIISNNFSLYCRFKNGIESYYNIIQKKLIPKWRDIEVFYIWGKTGTGKTRYAVEHCDFKIEGFNLAHWNGYTNEKSILIDEYNNDVQINVLLGLLDGYKLRLNAKYGFCYANWTTVYITSNLSPEELHRHANLKHREALMRRITKVIHMTATQEV